MLVIITTCCICTTDLEFYLCEGKAIFSGLDLHERQEGYASVALVFAFVPFKTILIDDFPLEVPFAK